ncbi:unnamed protein product [Ilex paraguariensis]|uniref:Pentatricopeptide repeat-containing protein n=1 Tax=Ilex paraguariensis TaxID=185542 RepID=A0ABC8QY93_9AQUA
MHSLRRELSEGLRPLHETFVALIRLFGSKGHATRGLEILAAMEKLNFDIRQAWLVLIEELVRSNHLEDANKVFLKGAKGGLRATDELYDLLIEEDCKAGDHSNALTIAYEMEAAGRMATTYHFNCLLSVQATCGIPEIAFATFENMEYGEGAEEICKAPVAMLDLQKLYKIKMDTSAHVLYLFMERRPNGLMS